MDIKSVLKETLNKIYVIFLKSEKEEIIQRETI